MNVLGIDLGIGKIACACYDLSRQVHLVACPWFVSTSHDHLDKATARARQLHEIGSYVHDVANAVKADHIFIESIIIGNNRKYSLDLAQTMGAVLSALHVVSAINGTRIHLVDNKAWKKRLLGNGNADKDAIRTYIDVTYPAYALLCDGDQDRYDACCIGLYGLDVLAGATDLKLSEQPG